MENSQESDVSEGGRADSPEMDLDAMAQTVEETLETTEQLALRLGELNRDMMEYMRSVAQATKAGSKQVSSPVTRVGN